MAVDADRLEKVRRMQQEIALDDPTILELDITDEANASAIDFDWHFRRMQEYGEPFTFHITDTERLEIFRTSSDVFTGVAFDVLHYSTDKKVSPEAAVIVDALLSQSAEEQATRLSESLAHPAVDNTSSSA